MNWNEEILDKINTSDDLKIAPARYSEQYGTPTWIWSVLVDKKLFVRAYNGIHSSWYKSAISQKTGIIKTIGQTFKVNFLPISDSLLNDKIDIAYCQKYSSSPYMNHMIQQQCRVATIEIVLSNN